MLHITEDGPRPCKAQKGNCPYSGEENHFTNMMDAQREYERRMDESIGSLPDQTKSRSAALKDAIFHSSMNPMKHRRLSDPAKQETFKKFTNKMSHKIHPVDRRSISDSTKRSLSLMVALS